MIWPRNTYRISRCGISCLWWKNVSALSTLQRGIANNINYFLSKILSNYPFCSEDQSLSGDPVCLPDMTAVTNVGWDHWCLTLGPGLMSTIGDVSRPSSTVSGHGAVQSQTWIRGSAKLSQSPGWKRLLVLSHLRIYLLRHFDKQTP